MSEFIALIPLLVVWALILVPTCKVLKRTGFNPWWALLSFVPVVNLMAFWWFSNAKWTTEDR